MRCRCIIRCSNIWMPTSKRRASATISEVPFPVSAKGIVFVLIGIFFLTAAWQVNSSESSGLGKALQMHQEQPYGPWVLGIVAVGLFAFGIYSVIEGAYRRIDNPAVGARLRATV